MVVQLIVQLDCAIPGGIVQLIVQIGRNCPQKCNEINFPGPIFQPGPQKCDEINFCGRFSNPDTRSVTKLIFRTVFQPGPQKYDEISFSDRFSKCQPGNCTI